MREINDSLDPEIESEISRREEEEGDITALLARLEQGEARKDGEQNEAEFQAEQAESSGSSVPATAVSPVATALAGAGLAKAIRWKRKRLWQNCVKLWTKKPGKSCIRTMSGMTNSAEIQTGHRKQCDRMNAI